MAFVEFDHVTKIYQMGENRVAAADGVTFTIEQGEFVVIVGPQRRGKNHGSKHFGRHRYANIRQYLPGWGENQRIQ